MQLAPVAPQPAGLVLKPIATKGTLPIRASYGLLRRTNHPSPAPLRAHSDVRRMEHQRSCPAARKKARDDEAAEPEPEAPAKKEGEEAAAAEQTRNRGQRSLAYQIFESVYLCAYVLSWRTGELIVANAEDALKRLRGYVLDKFNRKR